MSVRQEILETINEIAASEMHDKSAFNALTDESEQIGKTGIDSFDFIMLFMKISEHYGMDNKIFKNNLTEGNPTAGAVIDLIEEHAMKVEA